MYTTRDLEKQIVIYRKISISSEIINTTSQSFKKEKIKVENLTKHGSFFFVCYLAFENPFVRKSSGNIVNMKAIK